MISAALAPMPAPQGPTKQIILIRHGHSLGQNAKNDGKNRKTDQSLIDAGLSSKGKTQARNLPKAFDISNIPLIVSSPLTRALQTAAIIFKNRADTTTIIVHFHIREIGSGIPENQPRAIKAVLRDLPFITDGAFQEVESIDTSLQPDNWPDVGSQIDKADELANFKTWLYHERAEEIIAVICHHNVIVTLLDGQMGRIDNCDPIRCTLDSNGRLVLGD